MNSLGIRFWNRLHIRITLYGCIIALLALLPLAVQHFMLAPAEYRAEVSHQVETQGQAVALLMESADPYIGASSFGTVADALTSKHDFAKMALLDHYGQVLFSTDSTDFGRAAFPLSDVGCQECHRAGAPSDTGSVSVYVGQDLRYVRTIGSAPQCRTCHPDNFVVRGHLVIEQNMRRLERARAAGLWTDLFVTSLVVFLAVIAFYVVVRRLLIRRLIALETFTVSPVDDGVPPADGRRDELSRLERTIFNMRNSLARMLNRLEDQRSFLANLLESQDDGLVVLDARGNVQLVNQRLFAILGLPAGAMTRGRSWRSDPSWNSRLSRLGEWIEGVLETPGPARNAVSVRAVSRAELYLECHSTPLSDPGAEGPSVLVSIRDITDRRQAENQLYRAEKLATVGQLAAGVAHEINNPLACILTCASGLSQPDASAGGHREEYVDIIAASARRCKAVTEKLLSYAAKGAMEARNFDLPELLRESTELLQFDARRKRVHVMLQPTEDVPHLTGDRDLLLQVFVDLTLNGIQAVKRGGRIELSWGLKNDFVWVTVSDNGPGIPRTLHDRVFDPFFTTKRVGEGTGLGLSVSLGIVRQHGGTLELVESIRGRPGACFRVMLPLQSHLQEEVAVA